MLYESIKKLVQYGIDTGLTPECERVYTTNLLLELFHEDNYEDIECTSDNRDLEEILKDLLDEAVKRGIIEDSITYRDLFDTKIMNCLMPRPSQIRAHKPCPCIFPRLIRICLIPKLYSRIENKRISFFQML